MPTVKDTGKTGPTKPSAKPVTAKPVATPPKNTVPAAPIVANTPATLPAGLISSKSVAPSKVNLPSFLQQVAMPQTSNRMQTGYVGFASIKSKNWPQQQMAGLNDGQPYVNHNNSIIPVESLEFFLCMGTSFQSMMAGTQGEFIFVTRDMDLRVDPIIYKGNQVKLEPHYVCLLLVNLNNSLLPIKGDFRGTKSGGIENAIRAVEAAGSPDWLKLSDQHKVTAAFPQPFGRVYNIITTKRGVSKSNGNPYYTADCSPSPATATQMQMLVDAFNQENFNNVIAEAHTNYNSRIEFLDNIVANPPKIS